MHIVSLNIKQIVTDAHRAFKNRSITATLKLSNSFQSLNLSSCI